MSRIELIIPLVLWAAWCKDMQEPAVAWPIGLAILIAGLALLVMLMRAWATVALRRSDLHHTAPLRRFQAARFPSHMFVLVMQASALFVLGWGNVVLKIFPWPQYTPAILLSMLPVLVSWIGLAWARFPVDQALRESDALRRAEIGEPVFNAPTLGQYLWQYIRLNILVMLLPSCLILLVRDAVAIIMIKSGRQVTDTWEMIGWAISIAGILLLGGELFRRILPTQPMPETWAIRDRLLAFSKRINLRYRELLLWNTHHQMANAMVAGLIPQLRYVMMSDLLIARLSDDQIEAVFAHEAGHFVHRHMSWYIVFMITFMLAFSWLLTLIVYLFPQLQSHEAAVELAGGGLFVVLFFVLFGMLSRSFERQADVFGARSLSSTEGHPLQSGVNDRGAGVFSSALENVGELNHMPVQSMTIRHGNVIKRLYLAFADHVNNWLHGSIPSRVHYLLTLPRNPDKLKRFDRHMLVVRLILLSTLVACIAGMIVEQWRR